MSCTMSLPDEEQLVELAKVFATYPDGCPQHVTDWSPGCQHHMTRGQMAEAYKILGLVCILWRLAGADNGRHQLCLSLAAALAGRQHL